MLWHNMELINTAKTPGLTSALETWGKRQSCGRPKGSRNKLSEEFVAEVYADWCEHGAVAIQTLRETRPDAYVKVLASLLPRQVEAEVTGPTHEERVAELVERLAELDATQASLVRPAARRTGRLGNAGGNRRG